MASESKRKIAGSRTTASRNQAVELSQLSHSLGERVKELHCLYGISSLTEKPEASIITILQGVVELIPDAWQYPAAACARIKLRRRTYQTANFQETEWKQSETIKVHGRRLGVLDVYYLSEMPASDEGPFLHEERNLIHVIAERLGHILEHKIAENRVQASYVREKELREHLQSEMQRRVDFTRKLVHEIRTPLTALMATSQLLQEETKGSRLEKLAGYVLASADNLNNRVQEMHDVIRGEIGKLGIKKSRLDIGARLSALTDEIRPLAAQQGMTIELELPEALPNIAADPDRFRQIMLNLINNAFKYAKDGKRVLVRATNVPGNIMVEVKDYGQGIPVEQQVMLFEPRYQFSSNEKTSGGLGIGLALCKMLVELHGGKIWVRSRKGHGASFYFTLPALENQS